MQKLFLAAIALIGLYSTAHAQEAGPEEAVSAFVLNNSVYVLYHEIGHLFVGEFDIPILGKEEDAADNVATLLLLEAETEEADSALIDSADGWFLSDAASEAETYDDAEFYDTHSLDVQRAFQIVCLMVGSNAEIFGEVATEIGMEPERQDSCEADYVQTALSWGAVLEPFESDGSNKVDITISYEPSENHAEAAEFLEDSGFFEHAAEMILSGYALPRPITMRGTECGEPNAFYDPEVAEVVFCYELADHFYTLFENAAAEEG